MFKSPGIDDVIEALESLKEIRRPDGDNEGDPINSTPVYGRLSSKQQERVNEVEQLVSEYLLPEGTPQAKALAELNARGYEADLGPDQYEPDLTVGGVKVGDWTLDLGEPSLDED
tara:strand:- start:786 stop:1130 length:345 start_codon:yes stop_codon:yes gene_type:complete